MMSIGGTTVQGADRVFCVVLWTRMYLHQDGQAFPYCYAARTLPIGLCAELAARDLERARVPGDTA